MLADGRPVRVDNLHSIAPLPLDADIGPVMVAPVRTQDHVLGLLSLGRLANRPPFAASDLDLAGVYALQVAAAI